MTRIVSTLPLVDADLLPEMEGTKTCMTTIRIVAFDILPFPITFRSKLTTPKSTRKKVAQMDSRGSPNAEGNSHSCDIIIRCRTTIAGYPVILMPQSRIGSVGSITPTSNNKLNRKLMFPSAILQTILAFTIINRASIGV